MSAPRAEYERRRASREARVASLDRRHATIASLRLACAGAFALTFWLAGIRGSIPWVWCLPPVLGFVGLMAWHARVLDRRDAALRARNWYERGLARIDGRWAGTGRSGALFLDGHPFARDLDLFGRGSLFELLNTARTEAGEQQLAAWIGSPSAPAEVLVRQIAVAELRDNPDLREELSLLASHAHVSRTGTLAAWASAPAEAKLTSTTAIGLAVCAAISLWLTTLVAIEWMTSGPLILWFCVQAAIAGICRPAVLRALGALEAPERDLSLLAGLLARIERESFQAPRLLALAQALSTDGAPPSRRIAQLRRLVSWADTTRNQLFAPVAAAVLMRTQVAIAVARWHRRSAGSVLEWLRVVGEIEALAALATYAYEHPDDPFPAVVDEGPRFEATGLGHPLISEPVGVRNDIRLGVGAPSVLVVSGSNMSGKSTLLRSVGTNVVLALAGAPVRAERLVVSPLAIGATLKVEDSLQAGQSRFYAEIVRIRAIVDLARGPVPALFLLDEILAGTNSHDRRIGADAIVTALVGLGAIGLVTTHDLALTELPRGLGSAALNVHFEDRLEDGRLIFDYRMRPGVVEHSNALALMRTIGLDV